MPDSESDVLYELFSAVYELPENERVAFLDKVCGNQHSLREQVASLIAKSDDALQFLRNSQAGNDATSDTRLSQVDDDSDEEQIDPNWLKATATSELDEIGKYKIREKIGEGGMGEVYVAEQAEPVRRKVALKIIKPGMATKDVIARFEAERQALAMMSHPNIAKVLDGGTTADGRPYFVMELVRGIPITEFCDQQRFTTRRRLELFNKVCQAVQHAHLKGIIHRDLKPSNVLVELHDVEAVPKVIDFGIAKATNQRLVEHSIYTQFSQIIGTPLYMSPEQAELSGLDIDTRSDVYSLGVLLYELLTGSTPFDAATLSNVGIDEMRRMIREDDPPRPSHRVNTLDQALASTISTKRQTNPRELSLSMQRELDWIVMKALEKDRIRRYESASDFAQDIERYLKDEPVEACPPTMGYRLQKSVRRHRNFLIANLIITIVLLVGVASTVSQSLRASKATKLALAESERANQNLQFSMRALDEMYTEFAENSLNTLPGVQPLRMKILERALGFYSEFAVLNENVGLNFETALAWKRVGEIQHRFQRNGEAIKSLDQAVRTLLALLDESPDNPIFLEQLASIYWFISKPLEVEGRLNESHSYCHKAEAIANSLCERFPNNEQYKALLATILHQTGHVAGDVDQSLAAYSNSNSIFSELNDSFPDNLTYQRQLAHNYSHLGELLHSRGQLSDAEHAYKTAVGLLESAVSESNADVIDSFGAILGGAYRNWGILLRETDRSLQAEKVHRESVQRLLDLTRTFPHVVHYHAQLGHSRHELAKTLFALEEFTKAREEAKAAKQIFSELEKEHSHTSSFKSARESVETLSNKIRHEME